MHRITNVPVKTADGEPIGNATLEVDGSGNVQAHMVLDALPGQELMRMMEAALVDGLSIGPIATPALEKRTPILLRAQELPPTGNESLGSEEIESRFGFHKAAIEGPNATAPKHAEARTNFKSFAKWFDRNTPPGREKDLAMERLEEASMWFHKAIAKQAPIAED